MPSNYSYLKRQTLGIAQHNYSTFALRQQALAEQHERIKRNVESGDLTERQASSLYKLLGKA